MQRWTLNIKCILICFHLQLTYHVCIKCKHACTPANIHTEVTWSSLKNREEMSNVILLHWKRLLFLLFSVCMTKPAACQVKPCPWPNIWQVYRKNYSQAWMRIVTQINKIILLISQQKHNYQLKVLHFRLVHSAHKWLK